MENIHPNHNPLSKSLMLWSNTNTNFRYYHISLIMHMWKQINNISRYCGNHLFLLITGNTHPNHLGLYWSIFPNPVPEKIMSYFTSYKQQEFLLLLNLYWFYQADTASSPRCYWSISRINNRRFSSQNNPPAWTIHSLKSIHSHSTLSHWYLPLGR